MTRTQWQQKRKLLVRAAGLKKRMTEVEHQLGKRSRLAREASDEWTRLQRNYALVRSQIETFA